MAVTLILAVGCRKSGAGTEGSVAERQVETRPPNAKEQRPAFPGQTRAPRETLNVAFETRTIARGLDHPWSIAFLPDGAKLVTERPGRMRIVEIDGSLSEPLGGVPGVFARGQGGLLDVAIPPSFGEDARVYFSYSEPRVGGNGTTVSRARLVRARGEAPRLEGVEAVWRMVPALDSDKHFGSRLVFAPDGNLFITTGERFILEGRRQAQSLSSTLGKVVRIRPDGTIPKDNPFVAREGALPEIWSLGHRNVQAAALHPKTRDLWIIDHGPRGGDEINVARAGRNYGWPTITYGIEYSGGPVGEGITGRAGMEQPLYYWDPSIAPSGMAFYDGEMFPGWRGSLFVGALAGEHLTRLTLDGERVVGEERLLSDRGRIRDVRVGPNGALYLLTDESNGELLELVAPRGR